MFPSITRKKQLDHKSFWSPSSTVTECPYPYNLLVQVSYLIMIFLQSQGKQVDHVIVMSFRDAFSGAVSCTVTEGPLHGTVLILS